MVFTDAKCANKKKIRPRTEKGVFVLSAVGGQFFSSLGSEETRIKEVKVTPNDEGAELCLQTRTLSLVGICDGIHS